MKPTLFLATLALPLVLALPLAAQNVTITGSNGGTIQKTRDCTRTPGLAECAVNSTITGPNGQSATKERLRTTTSGSSATQVTRTGPNGEATTRNRFIYITR